MIRSLILGIATLGLLLPNTVVQAQGGRTSTSGLVSTSEARRFNLERSWFNQIQVDRSRGGISQVYPHINSSKRAEMIFEVHTARGIRKFSVNGIDRWGDVMGEFGATEAAAKHMRELLMERKIRDPNADHKLTNAVLGPVLSTIKKIDDLKDRYRRATPDERDKIDLEKVNIGQDLLTFSKESPTLLPKLTRTVQPEFTLYALTSRGVVHALDSETGKTRWSVLVGRRDLPSAGLCANDKYVAVVNGVTIYMLDALNGRLIWTQRAAGAPGGGPAISSEYLFVPLSSGSLLGYELDQPQIAPQRYVSHGRSLVQPLVVSGSVVWPTDRGFTYVANAERAGVRYRLETNSNVVSQPAYLINGGITRLFVTSLDGYVYCINERGSGIVWRFSTGIPITRSPLAVGDAVYAVTDDEGMYRLNAKDGSEDWWVPGITDFMSASPTRLYCRNRLGNIVILDAKTGGLIGQMKAMGLDWHLVNTATDRLFIGTQTGRIQCLHESDLRYPHIHDSEFELMVATEKPEEEEEITTDGRTDDGGGLFGGGADATTPAAGAAKPDDNPFD